MVRCCDGMERFVPSFEIKHVKVSLERVRSKQETKDIDIFRGNACRKHRDNGDIDIIRVGNRRWLTLRLPARAQEFHFESSSSKLHRRR